MTRQSWSVKVFLSMVCLLLLQCSEGIEKKPSKVILITLDTHRADYVSAYRSEMANTPNIDFFSQKGLLYENCYSMIPITAPAHAALFYSLPPHLLHLYNNGQVMHVDKKRTSLAEVFRKKGFKTAAFISLGVLKSQFALHHGFDLYDDKMIPQRWYLNAEEINEKVLPWFEKNKEHEFFVWVHYSDPHDPYAIPSLSPDLRIELNGKLVSQVCLQRYEDLSLALKLTQGTHKLRFTVLNPYPGSEDQFRAALNEIEFIHFPESLKLTFKNIHFVQREEKQSAIIKKNGTILIDCPEPDAELTIKARGNLNLHPSEKTQAYRQEVEYLDQQIGKLTNKLKELNLLDECLIVLVGDHGEGLGEIKTKFGDRYFGHIHYLNGVFTKVPFIIYDPTMEKKALRISEMTTILDVAPTILGRMGWKKRAYYKGRDLFKTNAPVSIFEETYRPEAIYDRFGMLQYPWHMIYTPETQTYELFDIITDPGETENIYSRQKDVEEIKNIQEMLTLKALDILKNKKEVKFDDKSLEMLKSLGYIK